MNFGSMVLVLTIVVFVILPSLKGRHLSLKKLVVVPLLMAYLFYQAVTDIFYFDHSCILLVSLGGGLGLALGVWTRTDTPIAIDGHKKEIWIPGSYLNLGVFCVIFILRFTIGYLQATRPTIFQDIELTAKVLLFSLAASSSVMVGSTLCLFYRYLLTAKEASAAVGT